MLSFLEYFFTGKSRLKKELAEALDEINPLLENLVDWSGDELELMSLIQDKRKVKSAFSSSVEGIICSIYQEHMIAYIWKKIPAIGDVSIIVASTTKYVFNYILKGDTCSFYVNNQYLGDFKKDNKLHLTKKSILASIKVTNAEWWQIHVVNEFVGSLVNINTARTVNPRAFQLVRNNSEEHEMILLSIAIFKIIELTRKMKKIPFE
jgi:hypothetical protein